MSDDLRFSPEALERWADSGVEAAARREAEEALPRYWRPSTPLGVYLRPSTEPSAEEALGDALADALTENQRLIEEAPRIAAEHARAAIKRAAPESLPDADDLERRVCEVEAACLLAGVRPAKTDKKVARIRPLLPEEHRRLHVRELEAVLGEAKERAAKKK
jgi:hypothetical protein